MIQNLDITDGSKAYTISEHKDEYWIENEDGEGMTVSEKNLFDLFDEYFKSEF